ncbi:Flagellar FliJ protein [Pigmentiphaga humi]|uniref:Flagellar FliJ protein n=1 Tax=Pigmentiphaga humi TaxID=2478468 RepID=A0A3P4B0W3_9BURK|nr:flagellar export protein FliJ [Pigmentiphaga humi]VCU69937.1 Flagellar FliJ protein [Pigmentiphaga humi]
MTSSATLSTLIDLAQGRKNKAAQEFAQAAAAHSHARERLTLIENYRADYETRMRDQAGAGLDGTLIGNYTRFIRQLSDAVEQQNQEVARCEQHLNATRAAFFEEERKLKSLEILAQREAQRQDAAQAKLLQKQVDEFAARRSFGPATGYAL